MTQFNAFTVHECALRVRQRVNAFSGANGVRPKYVLNSLFTLVNASRVFDGKRGRASLYARPELSHLQEKFSFLLSSRVRFGSVLSSFLANIKVTRYIINKINNK